MLYTCSFWSHIIMFFRKRIVTVTVCTCTKCTWASLMFLVYRRAPLFSCWQIFRYYKAYLETSIRPRAFTILILTSYLFGMHYYSKSESPIFVHFKKSRQYENIFKSSWEKYTMDQLWTAKLRKYGAFSFLSAIWMAIIWGMAPGHSYIRVLSSVSWLGLSS